MPMSEIVPGDRPGSFVLRLDGMNQSYVDLRHPLHLEFEYVRRIADVLDAAAPTGAPVRVVHVGGAAMTLPRYVAASRPRSHSTSSSSITSDAARAASWEWRWEDAGFTPITVTLRVCIVSPDA